MGDVLGGRLSAPAAPGRAQREDRGGRVGRQQGPSTAPRAARRGGIVRKPVGPRPASGQAASGATSGPRCRAGETRTRARGSTVHAIARVPPCPRRGCRVLPSSLSLSSLRFVSVRSSSALCLYSFCWLLSPLCLRLLSNGPFPFRSPEKKEKTAKITREYKIRVAGKISRCFVAARFPNFPFGNVHLQKCPKGEERR